MGRAKVQKVSYNFIDVRRRMRNLSAILTWPGLRPACWCGPVTGCAIALLAPPALANSPANVVEITDIGNYGMGIERKADVCMSVQSTAPGWVPEPIVILVHGGSWGNLGFDNTSGGDDKSDALVENRCWDLAGWGYIVVKIDYPRMAAGGSATPDTQVEPSSAPFVGFVTAISPRWSQRSMRRSRAC